MRKRVWFIVLAVNGKPWERGGPRKGKPRPVKRNLSPYHSKVDEKEGLSSFRVIDAWCPANTERWRWRTNLRTIGEKKRIHINRALA